jgi:hypothetical protein
VVAVANFVGRILHRARAGAVESERAQLAALLKLVERAVDRQDAADAVVARCGGLGAVPGEVGAEGNRVLVDYVRLHRQLVGLPAGPHVEPLLGRALTLVHYHRWILHEALHLAFATGPNARREQVRRRLHGLGAPAGQLRRLRDEITRELEADR